MKPKSMPDGAGERPVTRRALLRTATAGLTLIAGGASVSCLSGRGQDLAETIKGELMCTCGCNQVLNVCNHIGCPNAIPMRAEVDGYVEEGRSQAEILALFVEKYGPVVLSRPPTTGWFNLSAWLMPLAAFLVGTTLVAYYVRRFRNRWTETSPAPAAAGTLTTRDQRIEDELADFTPED